MNVLLVTVDAWRASHASFLPGVSDEYTPEMASLAEEGVAFSRAMSHGPATPYAFPALLTSTLPLDFGGYERLSPERTLLAEALSAAGYRCVGVHANPWLGEKYGYARGYDRYADVGEFGLPLADRAREVLIDRFGLDHPVYRVAQSAYRAVQEPLRRVRGGADGEVGTAVGALESLDDDGGDAFVWVHLLAPHAPYAPPERFREAVGVPPFPGSATSLVTRAQREPGGLSAVEREAVEKLYAASVRQADEQVGRVVSAAPDETLVVVTADHGEALFEHGQVGHDPCLYDELLAVPLLVRPPGGIPRGEPVVDTQVRHVDVAPTILDYAGVEPPASYSGRSLRPAVEGGDVEERPGVAEVASTRERPGRLDPGALRVAVRHRGRKLVVDADGDLVGFDLREDPAEVDPIPAPTGGAWDDLRTTLFDRLDDVEVADADHVERDDAVERRLRDLGYLE